MSLSKYESTQGTTHLARIARAILGPCTDVLRDVLANEISPPDLEKKVKTYVLRKGKPSISEKQKRIVYGKNYSAFDVTLLYFLLRNMCSIPPHKNTWGKDPELTDKSVSANIERIRILRNKWYGHSTCFSLSEPDFERKWNHISQIVKELEGYLGTATKYQDSLIELKTCRLYPDSIQHYMNALKTVEGLQTDVTNLQEDFEEIKKSVKIRKGCDSKTNTLDIMDTARISYRVHQCSNCRGDTEYFCVSCTCDLCPQCKEKHEQDLQTIDHDVVSHRDQINYIPTQEICVRHPSHVYINYCEPCQVPVCIHCTQHRHHRQLVVGTAYMNKRQQHMRTIHNIRSEALFYRPVLLPQIKEDIKTCRMEVSLCQYEMLTKACRLKNLIDRYYVSFCGFDFQHRCLKQRKEMIRHIVSLQRYEYRYVQPTFTFSALQFLSSIKKALPQIHLACHTIQLSMTESLNKEDVMKTLSAIQITERGNRRVGNQCLLKLMPAPVLHEYFTLTGVNHCYHISCVTLDRLWVSDEDNLILISTAGYPPHHVEDSFDRLHKGFHTVNSESDLIYITRNYNINKLSKDMKTTTIFIERTDSTWRPRCVYCSLSTGDLLVGMDNHCIRTGMVTRYNQNGQLTQIIQFANTQINLYIEPNYITENNNRDVVVSDNIAFMAGAVVVTEHGGRHRFSYTGHPSGSGLQPLGICTDALSNILVCDALTERVQMIDKDGQFLSYYKLLSPHSLCYDAYTQRLFVGSSTDKNVLVFRYITRQDIMTNTADDTKSMRELPITEPKKSNQIKDSLLKMMPKRILQQILITDARDCFHISLVASDRIWVSDYDNNLLCSNTIGETLCKVIDMCKGLFVGSHTVNTRGDLIYINRNFNIMNLSEDMTINSTLVKRIYPKWRPRCVYCSPFTEDLLVGIYIDGTQTGMVTNYNQLGELTHKIQQDNTGHNLYSDPLYITENNNGDIVVSDSWSAVVVTERGGRHRFSYTGHPSGSRLQPWGICTDALSHILVCDQMTNSVQLLDRDGQFLSYLLTYSKEIFRPVSLSYDAKTNHIWVGSCSNNKVFVYKYISPKKTHWLSAIVPCATS